MLTRARPPQRGDGLDAERNRIWIGLSASTQSRKSKYSGRFSVSFSSTYLNEIYATPICILQHLFPPHPEPGPKPGR
jgi:hypothetical protein